MICMEAAKNRKGVTIGIRTMIIIIILVMSVAFVALIATQSKDFSLKVLSNFKEFASDFLLG